MVTYTHDEIKERLEKLVRGMYSELRPDAEARSLKAQIKSTASQLSKGTEKTRDRLIKKVQLAQYLSGKGFVTKKELYRINPRALTLLKWSPLNLFTCGVLKSDDSDPENPRYATTPKVDIYLRYVPEIIGVLNGS